MLLSCNNVQVIKKEGVAGGTRQGREVVIPTVSAEVVYGVISSGGQDRGGTGTHGWDGWKKVEVGDNRENRAERTNDLPDCLCCLLTQIRSVANQERITLHAGLTGCNG